MARVVRSQCSRLLPTRVLHPRVPLLLNSCNTPHPHHKPPTNRSDLICPRNITRCRVNSSATSYQHTASACLPWTRWHAACTMIVRKPSMPATPRTVKTSSGCFVLRPS
uniref:Uncharacterized protein n=1 Tax=Cacopsylla melanoneura TaxID=428564 RepID=A0A8D8M9H6_9HEMI